MSVLRESASGRDVDPSGPAARAQEGSGSTAKPRPGGRGLPHLRELGAATLIALLLAVLLSLAAAPLANRDTYFHLRFGEEFLHGHWSLRDPGSVSTFATQHWLPTQWLPEAVMAQVYDWFGLAGVAWLSGLQQVAFVAVLYLLARRYAEPVLAAALLWPAVLACLVSLSARPQVLSYLFIALTVGAWLGTRDDGRVRWWLVPMTWVWAMCHGMWPVGIGLGVVAVVGLALDRATDLRGLLRAAGVPAASAVVAALTPVGPGLYGAVLGVGDRAHFFSEWQSPDFGHIFAAQALVVFFAVTLVLMLRAPRPTWTTVLLLLVAGGCAVQSYRTMPIAAIILLPLAARAGQSLLSSESRRVGWVERGTVAGTAVVALALLAVMVPSTADRPPAQGAWLDPAMSALPAGTPVLTSFQDGSYLMWAHPQLDLVAHGYGDTFTVAQLTRNNDILTLQPGWVSELRQTGVRIAVLDPDSGLAYSLQHQEGWQVEHRSSALEMLQAPADW
jgi:hypothetical protein